MKIASDNVPTSALANPRRGGFETRPWPPTLALTRPTSYRRSLGPGTFFITSRGLNKAIVIPSVAKEYESADGRIITIFAHIGLSSRRFPLLMPGQNHKVSDSSAALGMTGWGYEVAVASQAGRGV